LGFLKPAVETHPMPHFFKTSSSFSQWVPLFFGKGQLAKVTERTAENLTKQPK
jgi:hypothetical protein